MDLYGISQFDDITVIFFLLSNNKKIMTTYTHSMWTGHTIWNLIYNDEQYVRVIIKGTHADIIPDDVWFPEGFHNAKVHVKSP